MHRHAAWINTIIANCAMTLSLCTADDHRGHTADTTSTQWRDDEANLVAVGELNRAYQRLPFDREFEGVLNECPVEIKWSVGPNLPIAWKGGDAADQTFDPDQSQSSDSRSGG